MRDAMLGLALGVALWWLLHSSGDAVFEVVMVAISLIMGVILCWLLYALVWLLYEMVRWWRE